MREFGTPAKYTIDPQSSGASRFYERVAANPDAPMVSELVDGKWTASSAKDIAVRVRDLAKGLIAKGIKPGDRVALMSRTRPEWLLLDLAIWSAGAVTVPIFDSSAPAQIEWILQDSAATAVIAETADHAAKVEQVNPDVLEGVQRFSIDGQDGVVQALTVAGREVSDADVDARWQKLTAADPATLIYTSGTTGRPKGCILTHSNLLAESQAIITSPLASYFEAGKRTLMFLPLAHVFGRAISFAAIDSGVEIGYFGDVNAVVNQFAAFKPNFILSVPRVFEKVYGGARKKAHAEGKGKIFDTAAETARAYSHAITDNGKAPLALRLKHAVFDRLVYSKLRDALGGVCELAVSGGAPLDPEIAHFFGGVGLNILEGYGLTETTAAAAVNLVTDNRIGTVGVPLGGMTFRIAEEDNEILIKGPVVFAGYWNNEEATKAALRDGWFYTGDCGSIDNDGYVKITGRKKEILVTAGGKNVAPAGLEERIRANPLVSQAVVIGDKQRFIAALVTLDDEEFVSWKSRHNKPAGASVSELANDEELRAEIETAVAAANTTVSHAEAIKKFEILPQDFTEESGELTPSLKVKRNVVTDNYADVIEKIYAG